MKTPSSRNPAAVKDEWLGGAGRSQQLAHLEQHDVVINGRHVLQAGRPAVDERRHGGNSGGKGTENAPEFGIRVLVDSHAGHSAVLFAGLHSMSPGRPSGRQNCLGLAMSATSVPTP